MAQIDTKKIIPQIQYNEKTRLDIPFTVRQIEVFPVVSTCKEIVNKCNSYQCYIDSKSESYRCFIDKIKHILKLRKNELNNLLQKHDISSFNGIIEFLISTEKNYRIQVITSSDDISVDFENEFSVLFLEFLEDLEVYESAKILILDNQEIERLKDVNVKIVFNLNTLEI